MVVGFLLLDVVAKLAGQAYDAAAPSPDALLPAVQSLLVAAAAAATMWHRPRSAVVLSVTVAALALTVGPSGMELVLLVVTGVTAAARAGRRQLGLVALAQLVFAVCLGRLLARSYPGEGGAVTVLALAVAGTALTAGLVLRRLLRAHDRRQRRIHELERQRAEIRATERARLADELQTVVSQGLAAIDDELDAAARRSTGLDHLRSTLSRIDLRCRSLLTELRVLLDVLRSHPAPDPEARPAEHQAGPRRWVELLTARHVRIAASAVFGLLAARAAAGSGTLPDAEAVVRALGLLACAVVVWRPRAGAGCAGAALLVSTAFEAQGHGDVLSTSLLCLMAAVRLGTRRIWLVVLAVAAWGAVLAVAGASDPLLHLVLVGYAGFAAVVTGLAAGHFRTAREDSLAQLVSLTAERARLESEERNAVARELHDVVAHSLSVTTMLVMATSLSEDREELTGTLERVARSTQAARQELSTLLHAMRGPTPDTAQQDPLVRPSSTAQALGQRLLEHGHQPDLSIDPAADALDPTTQRTLSRTMQEAATNILRYAPPGSPCQYTLAIDATGVRLSIVSPLAASDGRSDLSLGWGLRGIRERVDLTGGTFTAGPSRGSWCLTVSLPAAEESRRRTPVPVPRAVELGLPPAGWQNAAPVT